MRELYKLLIPFSKSNNILCCNGSFPFCFGNTIPPRNEPCSNIMPTSIVAILIPILVSNSISSTRASYFFLGLNAALTKIKTINTEYETKLATRSAKQAENPLLPIKKLRESLSASYQLLSMKAFAFNLITPTSESQTFILRLNKLIEDTNLARKQHKAQLGVWTEEGGWEEDTPATPWTP